MAIKKKRKNRIKLPLLVLAELVAGIALSAVSFIGFLALALHFDLLHAVDAAIFNFFYQLRDPFLTYLMFGITLLGNQILVCVFVLVFLFLIIKKHGREATLFLIILAVSVIANLVFKLVIGRARPDIAPLLVENTYSFPSGHAMNSFVFYSALVLYFYRFSHSFLKTLVLGICSGFLILLIGTSRIYLGVHYFSDVIAGYLAGFWWIVTSLVIEKSIYLYTTFRRSS